MMMTQMEESTVNLLIMNIVPASTIVAGIIRTRGPYLSKRWPMKGDIAPFKILPGNRINPAVAADKANDPCMKIGKIISDANIAIIIIKNIKTACVYIGYLNRSEERSVG